jgi:hypothetical protein
VEFKNIRLNKLGFLRNSGSREVLGKSGLRPLCRKIARPVPYSIPLCWVHLKLLLKETRQLSIAKLQLPVLI